MLKSTQRILAFAAVLLGTSIPAEAELCKNHYILDEPCEVVPAWRSAANLLAAREAGHTATLLADGRVLVVGGLARYYDPATATYGYENLAETAEIYDPATDTWSWTGPENLQRFGHTATLLGDGRVLVVGGNAPTIDGDLEWTYRFSHRSAEIYDPATNSWSVASSLAFPREGHTATLLGTGEVLVTGGSLFDEAVAASEVFDPVVGQWRVAGSPAEPRWAHSATALPDGRVIIVGGMVKFWGNHLAQSSELFDPATATWSSAGSVLTRVAHTATSLPDGRLFIAGGISYDVAWREVTLGSTQIYDWRTGEWIEAAPMQYPRFFHLAAPFSGNSVLLAGGDMGIAPAPNYRSRSVDRDEVFANGSGAWLDLVSSGEALRADSVTPLRDGSLLFISRNRAAILK